MIISSTYDVKANLWSMTITTEVDSLDTAYINAYGEPTIDTTNGGNPITYAPSGSGSSTFVITGPPQNTYVRSGMPITFELQTAIDAQAQWKVIGWGAAMVTLIQAAMTSLKDNPVPYFPNTTVAHA